MEVGIVHALVRGLLDVLFIVIKEHRRFFFWGQILYVMLLCHYIRSKHTLLVKQREKQRHCQ